MSLFVPLIECDPHEAAWSLHHSTVDIKEHVKQDQMLSTQSVQRDGVNVGGLPSVPLTVDSAHRNRSCPKQRGLEVRATPSLAVACSETLRRQGSRVVRASSAPRWPLGSHMRLACEFGSMGSPPFVHRPPRTVRCICSHAFRQVHGVRRTRLGDLCALGRSTSMGMGSSHFAARVPLSRSPSVFPRSPGPHTGCAQIQGGAYVKLVPSAPPWHWHR